MADIFISYKAERRAAAAHIAAVLGAYGYSVWWDYALVAGSDFTRQIESELKAAKAVLVLWCGLSRESEWVRQEAMFAKSRRKAVPVFVESVEPPFGFQMDHTVSLAGWDGAPSDHAVLAPLLRELARLTGQSPRANADRLNHIERDWRAAGALPLPQLPLGPRLERAALPFAAPNERRKRWPLLLGAASAATAAIMAVAFWPRSSPVPIADTVETASTAVDQSGLVRDSAIAQVPSVAPSNAATSDGAAPLAALQWNGPCSIDPFEIYFAYDSVNLTEVARNTLEEALMRSRRCEMTSVQIIGHDETEASAAYSMGVSERRARAVSDFLIQAGVPADVIVTEARGQYALAVDTGPGVREPLNRRATVRLEMRLRD